LSILYIANQFRGELDFDGYFDEMRQTTLADFFEDFEKKHQWTENVNFLSLPLPFNRQEDSVIR
jgi:hypothetical protein